MNKIDIEKKDDAVKFLRKKIDTLGVLIQKSVGNRIIIKKNNLQYIVIIIEDDFFKETKTLSLDDTVDIIYENRNYINNGNCYNIGNGTMPIYLTN